MATVTDKHRLLRFQVEGQSDKLLPTAFTATERISGLFRLQVDLMAPLEKSDSIQASSMLGSRMNLKVQVKDEDSRYFDGVCCRFVQIGHDLRFKYYQAEIVPWMWLLTRQADTRIFQNQSVVDVLKSVLGELSAAFPKFEFSVQTEGDYKAIDYCVQFRETNFNFVSRLMEENGLYYFFQHQQSGHKLIIADSLSAIQDVPITPQVRYLPKSGTGHFGEDTVSVFRTEQLIHSGKFSARDYHFQMPQNEINFDGIRPKTSVAGNDALEVYDWPSGGALRYNEPDKRLSEVNEVGQQLTNLRAQEQETTHSTFSGVSSCRAFIAGYRFGMLHESSKYLLTEMQHSAVQSPTYETDAVIDAPYGNTFTGIPSTVQYRPLRTTPKPVVDGVQSALVVGASGEEIYVDKYGRVRVQFYWDRKGQKNEQSTCWVRVAQLSAGIRWGTSFWPRIGQEVLVAFLEGDPDQPVIVGSLYNAQQMPPYLGNGPDSKHKDDAYISGIKTNSTKGGNGYNELRFSDKAGSEQIFIHGEKDMDVRLKNDYRENVDQDYHLTIGSKEGVGTRNTLINKDENLAVKGKRQTKITQDDLLAVDGNMHHKVTGNTVESITGNHESSVTGNRTANYTGMWSVTTMSHQEKANEAYAVESGMTVHIKAGMSMVLEAGVQLSLKVGGNFVDINPAGVFINGTMLMLNSGGAPGEGPGASPSSPGSPDEAAPTTPDTADDSVTGSASNS